MKLKELEFNKPEETKEDEEWVDITDGVEFENYFDADDRDCVIDIRYKDISIGIVDFTGICMIDKDEDDYDYRFEEGKGNYIRFFRKAI